MQQNQNIFETLFNRNYSEQDNTDYLKDLTARHPYFSPAQFFLLEKSTDDNASFEKQAVKTNIFFNNPHWLNFQLQQIRLKKAFDNHVFVAPVTKNQEVEAIETDDLPDNTDAPVSDSFKGEKEIEPMRIELKMPVEKANLDETMLFEPMHLVDYFASQGIKLSEEVQTADKLG